MKIFLADEQDQPVATSQLVAMAERVLVAEGLPAESEVAIVLVGEEEMSGYNQRFMKRSGATDVLAFPVDQLKPGELPAAVINGQPVSLGDIFVCPAVVQRQAKELGVELGAELALIVTHGLLHLLGYDHVDPADAEKMSQREQELLALAGFSVA